MNNVPVMLFDGDCAFCQRWIERWRKITGDQVRYEPFQRALVRFPQVSEEACRRAVQLVLPGGEVLSGAHAVLRALAIAGKGRRLLCWYENCPWFGWACEGVYQLVARNRAHLSSAPGAGRRR